MAKKASFKRQSIDYLLSDMLPYEKGLHFTHLFFYKYLESRQSEYKKILKDTKMKKNYFDPGWHSAPLSFDVKKKNRTLREISLINPLGLVESLVFTDLFSDELIGFFKANNGFSLRKIVKKQSMIYKNKNGGIIYYNTSNDNATMRKKKQDKLMLETSGDFYKIGQFKTISSYLNSEKFHGNLEKYRFHLRLDIQSFFNSIYTHSFKWTISNEGYDSKKLKSSNSLPKNIDAFLQNLNASKTNGILTGPELFRTLAEYLLINIDNKIRQELSLNAINDDDYCINRFIDDYFIFSNDKKIEQKIKRIIEKNLSGYQLSINDNKVISCINEDYIPNQALIGFDSILTDINLLLEMKEKKLQLLFEDIKNSLGDTFDSKIDDYNKLILKSMFSNKALNNNFYYNLKSKTLKIISENDSGSKTLFTSYVLTTILNLFENVVEAKNIDVNNLKEKNVGLLIKYIVFLYKLNITYDSTKKITRIFQIILEVFPLQKKVIQNEIENSLYYFDLNEVADWIDLLLFCSSHKFRFTSNFIDIISNKIFELNNPLFLSSYLISINSNKLDFSSVLLKKSHKLIEDNIFSINWSDFFEDKKSWWVFIFLSYPKLEKKIKDDLIEKILTNKEKLEKDIEKIDKAVDKIEKHNNTILRIDKKISELSQKLTVVDREVKRNIDKEIQHLRTRKKEINQKENPKNFLKTAEHKNEYLAKLFLYNFLLSESKHFVEWDFNNDRHFQNFYFYTRKRTVFNPNFIDNNEPY